MSKLFVWPEQAKLQAKLAAKVMAYDYNLCPNKRLRVDQYDLPEGEMVFSFVNKKESCHLKIRRTKIVG